MWISGSRKAVAPILSYLRHRNHWHQFRITFKCSAALSTTKPAPMAMGGGDHARANATFLTGAQARKTAGADVEVGISVDQIAADHVGNLTRLPSLELTCDKPRRAGSCDSGYSCTYQYNISWKSETTPMTPERNPRGFRQIVQQPNSW